MQRIQRFATVRTGCALIRINAAVCIVVQLSQEKPNNPAPIGGPPVVPTDNP
jgi:hypothetical protein